MDPLAEIEDQIAGRVIMLFLDDLDRVEQKLLGTFRRTESVRKRAKVHEFGYESNHLIFNIPPHLQSSEWEARDDLPKTFEIQIRTVFMHAWAEPEHALGYKSSIKLPECIEKELTWAAASAWGADQALLRVKKQLQEMN